MQETRCGIHGHRKESMRTTIAFVGRDSTWDLLAYKHTDSGSRPRSEALEGSEKEEEPEDDIKKQTSDHRKAVTETTCVEAMRSPRWCGARSGSRTRDRV